MRRLALPLAAGALLAIVGLAIGAALRAPGTTHASPAAALAEELRCPDCEGLSVAASPSTSAAEIRRQIDALLAEGRTPAEVRQHFVDRYGEWILLAPRSPLPWLAPIVLAAVGIGAFAAWLSRRRASPPGGTPADRQQDAAARRPQGAAARRVSEEAEALDA